MRHYVKALVAGSILAITGCGTTYTLPTIDETTSAQASMIFAEARSEPVARRISDGEALLRFRRVSNRIEGVAESFCRRELADRPDLDCDVKIGIDDELGEPNAYFTYAGGANREPIIRVTRPLLREIQNDHELAFVLGHEYGHLISRHIEKQQQQALAGALIMGAISAAAVANNPYADSSIVSDNMELGMQIGGAAFSQSYELESDTVGTIIARSAGYDPAIGARFFARSQAAKTRDGALSFWGTHPPDATRVATVLAALRQIETTGGISRKSN